MGPQCGVLPSIKGILWSYGQWGGISSAFFLLNRSAKSWYSAGIVERSISSSTVTLLMTTDLSFSALLIDRKKSSVPSCLQASANPAALTMDTCGAFLPRGARELIALIELGGSALAACLLGLIDLIGLAGEIDLAGSTGFFGFTGLVG